MPSDPLADALMEATAPHPVRFAKDASPGDFAQLARLVLSHAETGLSTRLIGEVIGALREGLDALGHAPGAPWVLTGGLGDLLTPHLPDDLRAGLQAPKGRPLDGALRLAKALP